MTRFFSAIMAIGLFLSLPLAAQQSPDVFFKTQVGGDRVLISYPEIIDYFKHLAAVSPRVKYVDEGLSTGGRPIMLAVISSAATIADLPAVWQSNRSLTEADGLSAAAARSLAAKGKTTVLITATIHSSEIVASQMAMVLAHTLATSSDPHFTNILDQVVLLIMPSINPDGHVMVTDWYKQFLGTPDEGCDMPRLYHPYAGHDNNRDYYMLNLKESQVLNQVLHHRYRPQLYLDMHQMGNSGPRMFVPPFKDPFNGNLSPVMLRQSEAIGSFMALKLQEQGKSGVANAWAFDAYWPGGTKNTAWYKNVVGLLTELASVKIASPVRVEANELRAGGKGLPEYKAQVNFPDPWPGGWWRQQDIMEYEFIACDALLQYAAQNREAILLNCYGMNRTGSEAPLQGAPAAWIVPRQQWDFSEALSLVNKMREHGVRVYSLRQGINDDGRRFAAGDWVIPLNQPYRPFIQAMMERQRYPEIRFNSGGGIIQPYDSCGWTLPLLMGVKTHEVFQPIPAGQLEPFQTTDILPAITGSDGRWIVFASRSNRTFRLVSRLLAKGAAVWRSPGEFNGIHAGDFLVEAGRFGPALRKLAIESGVSGVRLELPAEFKPLRLMPPRLAIYQPYRSSSDEGWTRWVLDQYDFPYTVLHNSDFKETANLKKYDAIIFPSINQALIVDGKGEKSEYAPVLPKEFQGGITEKGLDNLKEFVRTGGRLILLDEAAELAWKALELPISNALADVSRESFNCPGSLLRLLCDPADPLVWGMEPEAAVYFANGPAFRTKMPGNARVSRSVAARLDARGPHLLSGFLQGESLLDNLALAVRFTWEKGSVVVLGGRVQHRAQTTGTFKLLFNAIWWDGRPAIDPRR